MSWRLSKTQVEKADFGAPILLSKTRITIPQKNKVFLLFFSLKRSRISFRPNGSLIVSKDFFLSPISSSIES